MRQWAKRPGHVNAYLFEDDDGLTLIDTGNARPETHAYWQQDSGFLITGDHLLPRIVPNISIWWGSSLNPLGEYLHSIRKFLAMGEVMGLPSHGSLFNDLDTRIYQIIHFHRKRLVRVLHACSDTPRTANDCIRPVLGKTDGGELIALIIGQVFALLAFLEAEGLLLRLDGPVYRFQAQPGALERLQQLPVLAPPT